MQLISNPSLPIKVIFEDEDIIIIDKQAGVPCYPLKEGEKDTIANGLAARNAGDCLPAACLSGRQGRQASSLWPRNDKQAGITHRLDNNTSGCLLAAKNAETYKKFRQQFDENKILKKYTALVLGETPAEGIIETPIIHDPKNKKRMKVAQTKVWHPVEHGRPAFFSVRHVGVAEAGKKTQNAHTSYKLLKKYSAGQYSLIEVTIKTGVRHQIRVHLASIGHPIAGDRLYQNVRQRARDKTGLQRQFLHASALGFTHPHTGKRVEFESLLPKELRKVLTKLDNV